MKQLIAVVLVGMLALSLAACAPKAATGKMRVKCPACGYEFSVPGATP